MSDKSRQEDRGWTLTVGERPLEEVHFEQRHYGHERRSHAQMKG